MLMSTHTLLGLAALLIVTTEVGYRSYLWVRTRRDMTSEEGSSFVMSAALTLLALLVGFTFGMAQSNYELRRDLVTHEANAISTAHLRHQLLDDAQRRELNGLMAGDVENEGSMSFIYRFGVPDVTPVSVCASALSTPARLPKR